MSNVNAPLPNSIVTPQSLQTAGCIVTAATTTVPSTATGNASVVRLIAGGGNGSATTSNSTVPYAGLLKRLQVIARGSMAGATLYTAYTSPDQGVTLYPFASVYVGASTVSTPPNAALPLADFGFTDANPYYLESGDDIWVSASTALTAGFAFTACYQAY